MGLFKGIVITDLGKDLLLKAAQGTAKIKFTRMAVGNGDYSDEDDLKKQKDLKSYKKDADITSTKKIDLNCININSNVSNTDVDEGFNITEVALYAKDSESNGEEIMYAIAIAEHPDFLPAFSSKMPVTITERFFIAVNDSEDVTVNVNVDFDDIQEQFNDIEDTMEKMNTALKAALFPLSYSNGYLELGTYKEWLEKDMAVIDPDVVTGQPNIISPDSDIINPDEDMEETDDETN